ncbi:DUF86 domain-containing protein [candidate division KSB1 bacterium]|nr:DUF86 domain-containing protein [candidate division KSB1 bacterium]
MKPDESIFLLHIRDAFNKIESYIEGVDEAAFKSDTLIQDGVIRQLEIVGEATKHLSDEIRDRSLNVPWQRMAGMRDKLMHGYFGVEIEKV